MGMVHVSLYEQQVKGTTNKHDVQLTAKLDPGVNGVPVPRLAVRISNPDSYSSSKKKHTKKQDTNVIMTDINIKQTFTKRRREK